MIARRVHSKLEAVCGIAYVTRAPQGVASGLGKTPLEKTGHEDHAPIGDSFPVEALGAFQAIHCVGGIIETASAVKSLSNTCHALSRRKEIRAAFVHGQLMLDDAHRRLMTSETSPANVREVCDAARDAWEARSSKAQLDTALQQAPEHIVDVVRYAIVSWASRVLSALKLAFKASTWISLAASILGVIGSAFQVLSGIVKWHASSKLVRYAKVALRRVANSASAAAPAPLQTQLMQHLHNQRSGELHRAEAKRTRARVETVAGIIALVFSAFAFLFPPLGFIAIATGLAYAGYRVVLGIRSFFSAREPNPIQTLHELIELMRQNEAAWLHDVLAEIGVPRTDRDAIFLLAQTQDTAVVSLCLERMLFKSNW